MKEIDFVFRTLFAELEQRCFGAAFEAEFPIDGRFVSVPVRGRRYWYFDRLAEGRARRIYVGPCEDREVTRRVEAFREIRDDLKARRKLVATLLREAGLPRPERFLGEVVQALAQAGFFRLRGVLVGTSVFSCYAGVLGVRLPGASQQTGDADFALSHGISPAVGDTIPPILDVLGAVDPTFREIPDSFDGRASWAFENATRFRVAFLTDHRDRERRNGRPAAVAALGGAAATPLRFLDFLIRDPIRSALLHGPGVPILAPAPERFAVHKLIVAARRRDDRGLKRDKDVLQAGLLIDALALSRRAADFEAAFTEAWARGRGWRLALTVGSSFLPAARREQMFDWLPAATRDALAAKGAGV